MVSQYVAERGVNNISKGLDTANGTALFLSWLDLSSALAVAGLLFPDASRRGAALDQGFGNGSLWQPIQSVSFVLSKCSFYRFCHSAELPQGQKPGLGHRLFFARAEP